MADSALVVWFWVRTRTKLAQNPMNAASFDVGDWPRIQSEHFGILPVLETFWKMKSDLGQA